jgi:hypothetical protein
VRIEDIMDVVLIGGLAAFLLAVVLSKLKRR